MLFRLQNYYFVYYEVKIDNKYIISGLRADLIFYYHNGMIMGIKLQRQGVDNGLRAESGAFGVSMRNSQKRVSIFVSLTLTHSLTNSNPLNKFEEKRKYKKACEERRCHFTPFVVSTDGTLGWEAQYFIRRKTA